VSGTINVTVVAGLSLVLDSGSIDSDTTGLLLRGLVNVVVVFEGGGVLLSQELGDGGSQSSLAVIDVTYRN
jgi:hypothetical protein